MLLTTKFIILVDAIQKYLMKACNSNIYYSFSLYSLKEKTYISSKVTRAHPN